MSAPKPATTITAQELQMNSRRLRPPKAMPTQKDIHQRHYTPRSQAKSPSRGDQQHNITPPKNKAQYQPTSHPKQIHSQHPARYAHNKDELRAAAVLAKPKPPRSGGSVRPCLTGVWHLLVSLRPLLGPSLVLSSFQERDPEPEALLGVLKGSSCVPK